MQRWALDAPGFVMEVAKFTYFQCQFTITFGFVLWVYVLRHYAYTLLRNVLFTTFMLALPGYILYPTAPPRMLPDEGFVDALQTAALNQSGFLVTLFGNPYAAMPSLHTATAILVGSTGVLVTRHLLVRLMWAFYPALVVFSIVATANHFFLDAIAGAGILAVALTHRDHAASPQGLVARAPRPTAHRREPTARRRRAPGPSAGLPPSPR